MSSRPPVILGYEAITGLGGNLEETWNRAVEGGSGVRELTRFPLREKFPVTVAGEVHGVDLAAEEIFTAKELKNWASPVIPFGMLAVQRALAHAGLELTPELASRTATTFSSAVGGLDQFIAADRELVASSRLPRPFANPNACINMVTGKVSILTGATGPILSTVGACATGSLSLAYGAMLLDRGLADVVLCGAVDFSLVEVIVAGFATMGGCFKPKGEGDRAAGDPTRASRPFSDDRRGFVVSEGAAALILCSREFCDAHGLTPRAELAGFGMTSDAHHFVAPHGPTITAAMRQAVAAAGLQPEDIGAINAHAASTKAGDRVEVEALREVFGERTPVVTANKSQLGHAMGAASAIEAVLAIVGLERGVVLPTINHQPDPDCAVPDLATETRRLAHEHVLSNAFGFGGCNCCLVLRGVSA